MNNKVTPKRKNIYSNPIWKEFSKNTIKKNRWILL